MFKVRGNASRPFSPLNYRGRAPAPPSAEDFYRGKTIRIIVGFSVGGGFDQHARIIARHMPRHIPGNPTMIVEEF